MNQTILKTKQCIQLALGVIPSPSQFFHSLHLFPPCLEMTRGVPPFNWHQNFKDQLLLKEQRGVSEGGEAPNSPLPP